MHDRLVPAFLSLLVLSAAAPVADAMPPAGIQTEALPEELVLDDFSDPAAWRVEATGGASASLRMDADGDAAAMCLEHVFAGLGGRVAIRRDLPLALPPAFRLSLVLRGDAPDNDLALGLVDAAGRLHADLRRRFDVPDAWTPVRYRRRHLDREGSLHSATGIEIAIENGVGGRGRLCFDALVLEALPDDDGSPLQPVAAMSTVPAADAALAADGGGTTDAWTAPAGHQRIVLDMGRAREFGGLRLRWAPDRHASRYTVSLSDDGRTWHRAGGVSQGNGGDDWIALPDADARYIVLDLEGGAAEGYALAGVEVQPPGFGSGADGFLSAVAAHSPGGWFPRGLLDPQAPMALLGLDVGGRLGRLAADGTAGVEGGRFSVSPLLLVDGRLATWRDVAITRTLPAPGVPLPGVHWQRDDLDLRISAFAHGAARESQLVVRYRLTNPGAQPRDYTLALAVQPLRIAAADAGGARAAVGSGRIGTLAFEGGTATVDGVPALFSKQFPDGAFAVPFEAGMAVSHLGTGRLPGRLQARDPAGLASGAWTYRIKLRGWESREVDIMLPMSGRAALARRWWDAELLEQGVADDWNGRLDALRLSLPPAGQALAGSLRLHAQRLLAARPLTGASNGPACAAGGPAAGMAVDLFRLGFDDAARATATWLAGQASCGDGDAGLSPRDTARWMRRIAGLWRWTGDPVFAERMWPRMLAGFARLEQARSQTPAGKAPGPGPAADDAADILPAWSEAATMAAAMGLPEAKRIAAARDRLRSALAIAAAAGQANAASPPAQAGAAALADAGTGTTDAAPAAVPACDWETVRGLIGQGRRDQAWTLVGEAAALDARRSWTDDRTIPRTACDPADPGFVAAALDMFAHVRGDGGLVLAAGIPPAWLEGEGIRVQGLGTVDGRLGYALRREADALVLELDPGLAMPAGGVVLPWPYPQAPRLEGLAELVEWRQGALHLRGLPQQLRIAIGD